MATEGATVDATSPALLGAAELTRLLGRDDLADRLDAAVARTRRPSTVVCVVGEFKQGKSTLVNTLVGEEVCPVDDDIATSVITMVSYGEQRAATVHRRSEAGRQSAAIDPARVPGIISEAGNPDNRLAIERVDLTLPSPLLEVGITLIDTPGAGGLGGAQRATLAFLPLADALLFVSDASAELSAPEIEFLRRAVDACPSVVLVLTKIDLHPRWRRIAELDAGHLERAGLDIPVLAVSSHLRQRAVLVRDKQLSDESGFNEVGRVLAQSVLDPARDAATTRALQEAQGALEQVLATQQTRAELQDPEKVDSAIAELEQAKSELEHLRGPAARWSVLLSDRMQNLSAEINHDFRGAMRDANRKVDEGAEEGTREAHFDELASEVQAQVVDAVQQVQERLRLGIVDVQQGVIDLLRDEAPSLPGLNGLAPDGDAGQFWADLDGTDRFHTGKKVVSGANQVADALRGASGGGDGARHDHHRPAHGVDHLVDVDAVHHRPRRLLRRPQRDGRPQAPHRLAARRDPLDGPQGDRRHLVRGRRPDRHRPAPVTAADARGVHRALRGAAALDRDAVAGCAGQRPAQRERGGGRASGRRPGDPADRAGAGRRARRAGGQGGGGMSLVGILRAECERFADELVGTPLAAEVATVQARIDEPIRIAIAGRVKAGKSTLLNALVGERLAATDAGECTLIPTWYRHGPSYKVTAVGRDGRPTELSFSRDGGRLDISLGGLAPDDVERIEVEWPADSLKDAVLVDTPGLASLNDETSMRTRELLGLDHDRASEADAVIYCLRHLHKTDAEYLGAFMDHTVAGASAANAIAVLTRADEVGAGRPDALQSAARIAARYATDARVAAMCTAVTTMAGLLAETGRTLTESEAATIRALAGQSDDELTDQLISVDRFARATEAAPTDAREALLDRLGIYGVRVAVSDARRALAKGRRPTAADLGQHLVEQSGILGLNRCIEEYFIPQTESLKARSALIGLRTIAHEVAETDQALSDRQRGRLEQIEARAIDLLSQRLRFLLDSGEVRLTEMQQLQAEVLVRDEPVRSRLGLLPSADRETVEQRARSTVERWRELSGGGLLDPLTAETVDGLVRIAESLHHEITSS